MILLQNVILKSDQVIEENDKGNDSDKNDSDKTNEGDKDVDKEDNDANVVCEVVVVDKCKSCC